MSKISYIFVSRYSLNTYEDVFNTYEWIMRCFESVFFDINDLKLSSSFSFTANQIYYECSSIDEFKENSFGLNIESYNLSVFVEDGTSHYSNILAHFYMRTNLEGKKPEIILSSYEQKYLISIIDALNMEQSILISSLDKKPKSDIGNRQPIDATATDNAIPSKTTDQREYEEPWYAKLLWQLVIPIAVTVIGAIIVWRLGFS